MQQGKGLPVFIGRYNLRGYGLGGSLISNLFKKAIPFLKPLAKSIMGKVKNEALRTGRNIAQDVFVDNISPKRSIKNRTKESFKRVLTGKGKQITCRHKAEQNKRTTLRDIFQAQSTRRPSKRKAKPKKTPAKKQKVK